MATPARSTTPAAGSREKGGQLGHSNLRRRSEVNLVAPRTPGQLAASASVAPNLPASRFKTGDHTASDLCPHRRRAIFEPATYCIQLFDRHIFVDFRPIHVSFSC